MGALMLLAFIFLFKSAPIGIRLAWGVFYAAAFVPLTYFVDRTAYRTYLRRLERAAGGRRPRRRRRGSGRRPATARAPSSTRAPSSLRSAWRSSGSKRAVVPRPAVIDSSPRADLDAPVEHGQPRVLLHLVVAERLARAEARSALRGRRRRSAGRAGRACRRERGRRGGPRSAWAGKRVSAPGYTQTLADAARRRPLRTRPVPLQLLRGAGRARRARSGRDRPRRRPDAAAARARADGLARRRNPRHAHRRRPHRAGSRRSPTAPASRSGRRSAKSRRCAPGETRGGMRVPPHDPAHTVSGGDEVTVAGITFEVVDVPGHSAGHVAFHHDGELFSGDLLFAGSVGRVDLEGGDWETLARVGARAARPVPAGDGRLSGPRPGDDARPGAADEPVPARAARRADDVSDRFQAPRGTHDVLPREAAGGTSSR